MSQEDLEPQIVHWENASIWENITTHVLFLYSFLRIYIVPVRNSTPNYMNFSTEFQCCFFFLFSKMLFASGNLMCVLNFTKELSEEF